MLLSKCLGCACARCRRPCGTAPGAAATSASAVMWAPLLQASAAGHTNLSALRSLCCSECHSWHQNGLPLLVKRGAPLTSPRKRGTLALRYGREVSMWCSRGARHMSCALTLVPCRCRSAICTCKHWARTPSLILGGKGVVSEVLSCLFQGTIVT